MHILTPEIIASDQPSQDFPSEWHRGRCSARIMPFLTLHTLLPLLGVRAKGIEEIPYGPVTDCTLTGSSD